MNRKIEGRARQQQNERRHEESDGSVEGRDIMSQILADLKQSS